MNTPQRLAPDAGRKDTFFDHGPFDAGRARRRAVRRRSAIRPSALVGHYDGTPPQAEALRVDDPARGRKPAGMDTALLAYSGISVKMLVDRVVRRRPADDVHRRLRDRRRRPGSTTTRSRRRTCSSRARSRPSSTARPTRCGPGDVVFSGVGSLHGFYNTGTERVRWLETQAPQPPVRHAYRWAPTWTKFEEDNDVG